MTAVSVITVGVRDGRRSGRGNKRIGSSVCRFGWRRKGILVQLIMIWGIDALNIIPPVADEIFLREDGSIGTKEGMPSSSTPTRMINLASSL